MSARCSARPARPVRNSDRRCPAGSRSTVRNERGRPQPSRRLVSHPPSRIPPETSMQQRRRFATRTAVALAVAVAAAVPLLSANESMAAAGTALTVDLASSRGPSTLVGEGLLYGINQDGSQPADQFLQPLSINAFRGGGWFSGGWIK